MKSHFDSAIVTLLQKDYPVCRRTIEWMTNNAVTFSEGQKYKVLPRNIGNILRSKEELDVLLDDVSVIFSDAGVEKYVTSQVHLEVEAGRPIDPLRMFSYDYTIARKTHKNGEPLRFPVSYVTVLKPDKGVEKKRKNKGILHAVDAQGVPICLYTYQVRYLDEQCDNTLFAPIYRANEEDPVACLQGIMSSISDVVADIPVEDDAVFYEQNILDGLKQRFQNLVEPLSQIASHDENAARYFSVLSKHLQSDGKEFIMRDILAEAEERGVQKGRQEGIQEGRQLERQESKREYFQRTVSFLMSKFSYSYEEACAEFSKFCEQKNSDVAVPTINLKGK